MLNLLHSPTIKSQRILFYFAPLHSITRVCDIGQIKLIATHRISHSYIQWLNSFCMILLTCAIEREQESEHWTVTEGRTGGKGEEIEWNNQIPISLISPIDVRGWREVMQRREIKSLHIHRSKRISINW